MPDRDLSGEELRELKEAFEAATKGEWRKRGDDRLGYFVERAMLPGSPYGREILSDEDYDSKEADCDFIALAHNKMPQLLALAAENRRLREASKRLIQALVQDREMGLAVFKNSQHTLVGDLTALEAALKEQSP